MAFSPRIGPPELAKWLLGIYGDAYRDDIDKLKSGKINGELFLELEEDEEFLKELNLSPGFKRLVKKKAKELKQSNGAVADAPQPPSSNGQANGASTAATVTAREHSVAQAQPTQVSTVLKTTDRLSPNHLQQVLDLLWEARPKYYSIGLALDLPADIIDTIERSNSYKVEAIFTEMIKECLRRGLVTKTNLAKAVCSPQVGFAYLSDDILAKKFTASKAAQSAPPAVVTDADFDKFEVKHHFLSRLEWIDSATGEKKCVRVYNKAAWRWKNVAESLGLELGEIESIRRNYFTDDGRVTDVFRHWFDNANNLPNKKKYPKKWSGLIRLLKDADLGECSEEVKHALSAESSSVRGNLL